MAQGMASDRPNAEMNAWRSLPTTLQFETSKFRQATLTLQMHATESTRLQAIDEPRDGFAHSACISIGAYTCLIYSQGRRL